MRYHTSDINVVQISDKPANTHKIMGYRHISNAILGTHVSVWEAVIIYMRHIFLCI